MGRSLRVRIRTYHMETGELYKESTINLSEPKNKDWLIQHILWAALNGYGIQLCNTVDAKD